MTKLSIIIVSVVFVLLLITYSGIGTVHPLMRFG